MISWLYESITYSLYSLIKSFLSCSVSLSNLSKNEWEVTIGKCEIFFGVSSMEYLQYLFTFIFILLEKILVLSHYSFRFFLEVLKLRVQHCYLSSNPVYYFLLLEDGFIIGEQQIVQILQLTNIRVIDEWNFTNPLELFQNDIGIYS